jgi:hypothetical protein
MNQLNLFDVTFEDLFKTGSSIILPSKKPLQTLKRSIKIRKIDPDAIERRLTERIGTLYLHRIQTLKEFDSGYRYESYLQKRIYTTFFKSLVESITRENYEEPLSAIAAILSDETVTVTLERITTMHSSMVKGIAVKIVAKSKDREIHFITGTEQRGDSKHHAIRYFTRYGTESARMIVSVEKIFSELLLEKEARHFFKNEVENEWYKECLRKRFIKTEEIIMDEQIDKKFPMIRETLTEDAVIRGITLRTIKKNSSVSNLNAILGYYDVYEPAGLGVMYHDFVYGVESGSHVSSINKQVICRMIDIVIPKIHEVKYHVKSLRKSSTDYAATYQLKKNIPEKTLSKMKTSKLLNYFCDVEYDELVNLTTITQFEDEIISLIETFNVPVPSDASFKVRRLGKLKAAGVFYPTFNTLAVDVNHPHAFIHEFWHMIDYYMKDNAEDFTGERLSSGKAFESVVKVYRDVVTKAIDKLDKDSKVKQQFYGKTKYNKDYYFDNTEIFARCAEIFFSKQFEGKSSLVDEKESVYYPGDEILVELINGYFKGLLQEVTHEKTNAA